MCMAIIHGKTCVLLLCAWKAAFLSQIQSHIIIHLTAYLNPLLKTAVSTESARFIGTLMSLMEVVWLTLEVLHLNLHHTC